MRCRKPKKESWEDVLWEVDAVHSPTLFYLGYSSLSSSTPFSFSLLFLLLSIPLSLVYWLHSEFLHKSALISMCLIVWQSYREATVTLHTYCFACVFVHTCVHECACEYGSASVTLMNQSHSGWVRPPLSLLACILPLMSSLVSACEHHASCVHLSVWWISQATRFTPPPPHTHFIHRDSVSWINSEAFNLNIRHTSDIINI